VINGDSMEDQIPASQQDGRDVNDEGERDTGGAGGRGAKYPCIRCKKNVGRNSVQCKTCQLWMHVECGGISKEVFNILANPAKYGLGISWNCDSCQASAARLETRMNALEGRFVEVEARVIRNEGVVQEAKQKVESVEARQTKLEQAMEQERERMRRERAEEMRERDTRRKNVIMHRVGEAGEGVRTIEERKAWDLQSCGNIFRALNLDFSGEEAVKFCRRVGEKGAGPRPLVVGLRREWQKEDLLEKAKDLRNTQFPEVSIIPDLTQEQRREEAEMNKEVERRNRDLPPEDRAKNLEWMVVGARGERRMVKGVVRTRPVRGAAGGAGAAGRPTAGGAGGRPAAVGGLAPQLLPSGPSQDRWDPAVGGRGAGAGARGGQRGRGGRRPSTKRTRAERLERDENESETEEELMDTRQAPPPPGEN
jgi:hypothetical protein